MPPERENKTQVQGKEGGVEKIGMGVWLFKSNKTGKDGIILGVRVRIQNAFEKQV